MRLFLVSLVLLLSVGCSSTPVKVPFPDANEKLMQKPKKLKPIRVEDGDTVALSEFTTQVAQNYAICHENMIKYQAWQHWYKEQKKLV